MPLEKPDVAVLGFPCRPYSDARTGSRDEANVQEHPDFPLTTEAIRFVERTRPLAALFDNITPFARRAEGFCGELRERSYHASWRILHFNLWVHGTGDRLYVFALDARRVPPSALEETLRAVDEWQASRALFPPAPLRSFFLTPGTVLWEQHVASLLSLGGMAAAGAGMGAWIREARELRELWRSHGFELWDARPWTEGPRSLPSCRGLSLTPRVRELLDLGFLWACWRSGRHPIQDRDELVADLFPDVSQNPGRKPWSVGLRRVLRNSRVYSYEHDRILSAYEVFRIYGWRDPVLQGLTESQAWDLVGDSMALPPLAVALFGLLLGARPHARELWDEEPRASDATRNSPGSGTSRVGPRSPRETPA